MRLRNTGTGRASGTPSQWHPALDTLADLGFTADDPDIHRGLEWLVDHQGNDGLWNASYVPGKPAKGRPAAAARPWITLSICRVIRKFCRNGAKR